MTLIIVFEFVFFLVGGLIHPLMFEGDEALTAEKVIITNLN